MINKIREWWHNRLFAKCRTTIRPLTNDIYAVKLKDGKHRFIHIPSDDELAFSYARGLQYVCQLNSNKVTINEEKFKQKGDWLQEEIKKGSKLQNLEKEKDGKINEGEEK